MQQPRAAWVVSGPYCPSTTAKQGARDGIKADDDFSDLSKGALFCTINPTDLKNFSRGDLPSPACKPYIRISYHIDV